ncbi:glutaminase [Aureimonas populi]|uniref:Glutaminase n=1 Tax=Aureimonas populi TaxID=1701758 RepID=A0ABW5CLW1_9HYPH|nr:glutaminase [Aureimonas populi]
MPELQDIVAQIVEEVRAEKDHGTASDALPQLAGADLDKVGLAVVTADCEVAVAGDADEPFSLQSISKVFSLTLALEAYGEDVWKRVGREPSGDPFNSIIDLERHEGFPRNPFINAGALVVVDLLLDRAEGDEADLVRSLLVRLAGDENVRIDEEIASSDASSSYTNQALANFAKSFGNLNHSVDSVIEAYTRQCSLSLSSRDLAKAGRFLMNNGADPEAGTILADGHSARQIASLMMTCGQYDGSGEFAARVGLPAKSGIAGGILAVAPRMASIAVWSPGLDKNGNSMLGTLALAKLSQRTGWSVFG